MNRIITQNKIFILMLIAIIAFLLASNSNLKNFEKLTKNDPLFFSPSTDLTYLKKSAEALKGLDKEIINLERENKSEAYPEGWSIWPSEFLLILPQIHLDTSSFLENPTEEKAKKLIEGYEKAVSEYKKAIQLHIEALEKVLALKPDSRHKKILFLGSATTPEIALNDFKLILKNAQKLEEEVEDRKRCLLGGKCPKIASFKPKNIDSVKVDFKPLDDDILGIKRGEQKISGPFWVQTGCFGFKEGKPYSLPFYVIEKPINIILTNEKYYRDYRLIPNQAVAKLWLERGITVRPHPALNDYLCTDLRYLTDIFSQYLNQDEIGIAVLPYLMDRTERASRALVLESKRSKKPYDPLFIIINRSAYSIYFGTFSNSIWRIEEEPTFLLKEDFTTQTRLGGYIKYQELVSRGMSSEDIKKLNLLPRIDEIYEQ